MPVKSAVALVALIAAPAIAQAPAAPPEALYCMRVEPVTGSLLESVQCYTRADWADADVDVDADWAENGVRVIG